jgi:hypothetical protein
MTPTIFYFNGKPLCVLCPQPDGTARVIIGDEVKRYSDKIAALKFIFIAPAIYGD